MTVEFSRLRAGEWIVELSAPGQPVLEVSCHGTVLEDGIWEDLGEGRWRLRQPLPVQMLEEGAQTLLLAEHSGEVVARLPLLAGAPVAQELVAQVDRLQAELDLLKRAFRAHCRDTR
ncbi:hypothetical protein [Thioclava sp. GXIMD2076]|uniref:Uncharacterized protein n=1 Tax=Thioclava kandeliae TaxID=3070818 RepID=A0ABV1SCT0_9RHOB